MEKFLSFLDTYERLRHASAIFIVNLILKPFGKSCDDIL